MSNPSDFRLPERYSRWRYGQEEALWEFLESPNKVVVAALPTGVGKSVLAIAAARALGLRTVVLTSTLALQDQYQRELGADGLLADVRGRRNYLCNLMSQVTAEEAQCVDGEHCHLKGGGCSYYDAVRRAAAADVVVTSYAFWISNPGVLGARPLVVCDEAHELEENLTQALSVDLDREGPTDIELARPWATERADELDSRAERMTGRARRIAKGKANRLRTFASSTDEWVCYNDARGWHAEPLWPGHYAPRIVWSAAERVLLMSATISRADLPYVGLEEESTTWVEYDSPFPADRRPIYLVPSVRLNFRSSQSDIRYWASRVDQVVGARLDRKGIIHTVSYARARTLADLSAYQGMMVLHSSGEARSAVARFKSMSPPALLVSPSVATGVDFPYEQGRFQILAKTPYPDTQGVIAKARASARKGYSSYLATRQTIQAAGRVMRAEDDLGETFLVDDMFKAILAQRYLPRWFVSARRKIYTIPPAPEID